MDSSLSRRVVMRAVLMALWNRRRTDARPILHSDRGSQYTSDDVQAFLEAHGITSRVGSCYDNAVAESFFGLLKRERVNRRGYATRTEAG